MRRRVNILLALTLVLSVFAGAFGTASADHDENAPSEGHAFLPWVPNGSELGDQGPYHGGVTVQNLEDDDVSVDVYVGQGDGWNLEETVNLASRESITLSASQINVPEPGSSVVLEGFLQYEETMTCQEIADDADLDIADYPDCEVVDDELQNPDDEVVVQEAVAGRIAAVTKNMSPNGGAATAGADQEVVDGYSALTHDDVVQAEGSSGTYVLPIVQTNNEWDTVIHVANMSAEGGIANATVTLYGSGTQGYAGESQVVNLQIEPGQVEDVNLSDHVEEGWVGSAFITSGADIGAVAERYKNVDDMLITNTSRPEELSAANGENGPAGTVKYGSLVFQRYNFWNTGISVANTDPNQTNNVTITYYGPTANQVGQDTLTIPPRGQEYVYTPGTQDLGLEEGFVGSVIIEGSTELHASIDQVKYFGEGNNVGHAMSYVADDNTAAAGESLDLPLAQKGNPQTGGGDTSGIQLFNPTGASATAEIVFYGANGVPVAPTVQNNQADPMTIQLAAGQSYTLYTHELGELSAGFHGSVGIDVVDGAGEVIGVSNNVNYDVQGDGSTAFNLIKTDPLATAGLTLEPAEATNVIGDGVEHEVTATFLDSTGDPVEGETIEFSVETNGTATPATGEGVTDANGQATFTYSNDTAGTDTITATHAGSGNTVTATKTWVEANSITAEASNTQPIAGDPIDITATVMDADGNPVEGVDVQFQSDLNGDLGTVATDASGNAVLTGHTNAAAGTEVITATEQGTSQSVDVTVTWQAAP